MTRYPSEAPPDQPGSPSRAPAQAPPKHTYVHEHTALHRGDDQVQRIFLCCFIWQIIEPYPCGLGEELHPYSCLAFPVETNTRHSSTTTAGARNLKH